jgi:Calcineurin-like phosphoesterase
LAADEQTKTRRYRVKIMIVGDVHGDLEALGGLLPMAASAGCRSVVQLGDFGWEPRDRFFASELEQLDRQLAQHRLTLYWLDGNHDDPNAAAQPSVPTTDGVGVRHERLTGGGYYGQVRFLPRGCRWRWGGTVFCALGGADSTIERFMGVPDSAIDPRILPSAADVERAIRSGRADILLSHDCAVLELARLQELFGVERDHPAARFSRSRIAEVLSAVGPPLHFHGHYHRRLSYAVTNRLGTTQTIGLSDLSEGAAAWTIFDPASKLE